MAAMSDSDLFLRACRREPVERTPVWMMRQAGRYLPQYQAVRSKVSFLELCKTPELACEVTLQPIDEFGFDAAILFSDILIPLEAMGLGLEFTDHGPALPDPVANRADVDRLVVPDPEDTMPFVMEAVRQIRKGLGGRVPLIGFAGAPFTLATYSIEGGGSKSYAKTKGMMFSDPSTMHALLGKLAECCATYLEAQVAAGAQAVQLFDSWAGILSPRDFRDFALGYAKRVFELLKASPTWQRTGGVPIIYFVNGCAPYLEDIGTSGADVIGIDWRISLATARKRLGPGLAVQGNMDPTCLFLPPEGIRERVGEVLGEAGDTGHVFNLGHGVLPMTNPEHVRAMVQAVRELSARS